MAQDIFAQDRDLLLGLQNAVEMIYESCPPGQQQYGLWKGDENLSHNMNQLRQQSERLSSSCTKLGLIDIDTMPLPGLKSLLDEVLLGGQSVFQCYSILATSPISPPLREMLTNFVRSIFKELLNFLAAISSGQFEVSKSSLGLVWDAVKVIQTLPNGNKAAYRRGIMEVMTLIRDTEKEFQESLATSKEFHSNLDTEQKQEKADEDDFDDFDDIEEDHYTPDDILILEPCLQVLNCSFRFLKDLVNLMTEWSESSLLQTDQIASTLPLDSVIPIQVGVYSLYSTALSMKKVVVDIGVELYTTPIETNKLKPKINELLEIFQLIFQELDRVERGGDSEERNEARRSVAQELKSSLQAIDTEARFATVSIS